LDRVRFASRLASAAIASGTKTVAMMISTPQVLVKSATEGGVLPGLAGASIATAKVISRRIAQSQLAPTTASRAARTWGLSAPGSAKAP
jgi:hypothetical protein